MGNDENRCSANRGASAGEDLRRQAHDRPLSLINRRRFLAYTSGCLLGAAGGAVAAPAGESKPAPAAKPAKPTKPVDIGFLKDLSKDVISEDFIQHNFFVIRYQDRLFATTSTCTHQANDLFRDPQDPTRIKCSGHESVFDSEGRVVVGPASKSLPRFGITLKEEGKVIVNPAKQFPEDQWSEKGSSLEIQ